MPTAFGPRYRYCDGVSRRSFLQIGGLAVGGLTLPNLLRAERSFTASKSKNSVIMVYLSGGLAHQDTFDLKPNAPKEVRGEFKPIATNVPGIHIGELLPSLSRCMDKLILLRSLVGLRDEHSSFQSTTGFTMCETKRDGKPHFGSVIAKMQGPRDPIVPPSRLLARIGPCGERGCVLHTEKSCLDTTSRARYAPSRPAESVSLSDGQGR